MDTTTATYLIYAVAALALTGVLAKTLHRNGKAFLTEVFENNAELAGAVNSLLVIGFYMLNLGYAFFIFRTEEAGAGIDAIENLVAKLGVLLLSLGVIHFVNLAVFWRIRSNATVGNQVPATFTTMVPPPPKTAAYAAEAPY